MLLNYKDEFIRWCNNIKKGQELYEELIKLSDEEENEIEECFYKDIEFGTGGLRGIRGVGTNRINVYTVAKASQGLANYMIKEDLEKAVAIAYDTRINSKLFAQIAAEVLASNGIKVYMFQDYSTVPQLSFAIRKLGCGMGVIITASHNPAKYNGYKVYCKDGYQATDSQATAIFEEIKTIDIFKDIKKKSLSELEQEKMVTYLGTEMTDAFIEAVIRGMPKNPEADVIQELKVVYTALNGAGAIPVTKILKKIGIEQLELVKEQMYPDGNFPTCTYPNPEIKETMTLAENLALKTGADLILATDPDCDRVGTGIKTDRGFVYLTGNQIGILLFDYIIKIRKKNNSLPKHPKVATTIVTSKLLDKLAEKHAITSRRSLIGFKYIGEYMTELEKLGDEKQFILGLEESYGYLTGTHVRDKDGVNAVAVICQMAADYKKEGKTLVDVIEEIYNTYGYEEDLLLNLTFEGKAGADNMESIMKDFREKTMYSFLGYPLTSKADYKLKIKEEYDQNGKMMMAREILLPTSNIIEYQFTEKLGFTVRPSGTEPKIKIYIFTISRDKTDAKILAERAGTELRRMIINE